MTTWPATRYSLLARLANAEDNAAWLEFEKVYQPAVYRYARSRGLLLDQGVERVRVADFGLARISNDASFTRSGVLAGTPQFMAPEQVRGEVCDARSDLFSLGSVIYAMCTGHPPFRAETVYGVMQRIVHDVPRPIREQNGGVPDWLERFVDRLLAKDKAERFSSSAQVVKSLELELAHLQSSECEPAPPRLWLNSSKKDRKSRSRRSATFASLTLIAIVVASMGLISMFPTGEPAGESGPTAAPGAPQVAVPEIQPVDVPLWNDGMQEALQRAAGLEQLERSASDAYDPWEDDLQRVRQRMQRLAEELP